MATTDLTKDSAEVQIRNIGGIDETTVSLEPGVNVLTGRNATNRTSFLRAIMGTLGSDDLSLKADADEGEMSLSVGGDTYTRTLTRQKGTVATAGDPYLDDSEFADLFAFLLESNEARQTVARGNNLRNLIMRPVDTKAIEAEVSHLVTKREELKNELDELESLKSKLPGFEEERTKLQEQISEKEAELETTEEELDSIDGDIKETRAEKAELEEKLQALQKERSEFDDVRYDLETERESMEALRAEREELEAELDSLPKIPTDNIEDLDSEIRQLRDRKQNLEAEINSLQSAIGFNEDIFEEDDQDVFDVLGNNDTDSQLTDQLLDNGEVTCWTCGSTVDSEQIETTIEHLREFSQQKLGQVNDIDKDISELREERRELEQAQRKRDQLDRQRLQLDREISESKETIERLRERRETLTEEIETIEATVEEREEEDYGEILDLQREANQLEYELGRLEADLNDVNEEIASIEDRLAKEEDIKTQLEEIQTEIKELRTRIERLEQDTIKQFNEHMDAVLELLEYENLDRIWLERVEREVREGRKKVTKVDFELHIIRSKHEGTAYEDTVDHLSESEREVVGLVFALAGYLAHEVYEQVPFMLLDSLEAIDAERIATLIDYFNDYAEYLIVALLPEDAAALPETYERVTNI